jgi:hypothetical protein
MRESELLLVFDEDGSVYARLPDWVVLTGGVPEATLLSGIKQAVGLGFKEPLDPGWEDRVIRSRGRSIVWFRERDQARFKP